MTLSQRKRKWPHVHTQRLAIAVGQRKKKAASRAYSKASYCSQPDKKKAASRAYSRASYSSQPDKKKAASKATYSSRPEKKKAASRAYSKAIHSSQPEKKRAASRTYSKARYSIESKRKNSSTRAYYSSKKGIICAFQRDKYAMSEPKLVTREGYIKDLKSSLLSNPEVKSNLIKSFKKQQTVVKRVTGKAVCSVAAKRLVTKALQVRKEHAGSLLKIVRTVQSMQINGAEDFGKGCHTASTEPYFYDSAYEPVKRDYYALPIDKCGKCVLANEITDDDKTTKGNSKPKPMKWACTIECKNSMTMKCMPLLS